MKPHQELFINWLQVILLHGDLVEQERGAEWFPWLVSASRPPNLIRMKEADLKGLERQPRRAPLRVAFPG